MFTGQIAVLSNRATWQSQVMELVQDNTTTDLTLVSPLDIVVTISENSSEYLNPCIFATASIDNGKHDTWAGLPIAV